MTQHFVYYLADSTGEIVYVGRSMYPEVRLAAAIRRYDTSLTIKKLRRPKTLESAKRMEISDILLLRPKFNKVAMSVTGFVGGHHTAETKEKLRIASTGRPGTMTGKTHTAKARQRISEANKGRAKSAEERAKLSAAHTGMVASAQAVENMRRAQKALAKTRRSPMFGRNHTEEAKRKMSETRLSLGIRQFPETLAKIAAASTGRKHSEEAIKKMSDAKFKYWERKKENNAA